MRAVPGGVGVAAVENEPACQDLRVSRAEREHAAELLTGHLREGGLTVDEYAEPTPTIDVELGAGNLDIRLPKDAPVDLEDARTKVGSVVDRTEKSFERGDPHVVVRGGTAIGNIRVRHRHRCTERPEDR